MVINFFINLMLNVYCVKLPVVCEQISCFPATAFGRRMADSSSAFMSRVNKTVSAFMRQYSVTRLAPGICYLCSLRASTRCGFGLPTSRLVWTRPAGTFIAVHQCGLIMVCLLPAIRSLERKARYLFYYCCSFFCQRFLDNPRANSRQIMHAGVLWFRMCLLPFWGGWRPRRAEKGGNEIFVTMGVNGEFWWFLSVISATLARIHTKYYLCRDNVCRRAPSPCGAHRPLGVGGGELKTQKIRGSHSCIGQLPFLFFSAMPNVVQYVGHRPAHIVV